MSTDTQNIIKSVDEYSRDILIKIAEDDFGIVDYPDASNKSKPTKQEIADRINFEYRKINNIDTGSKSKEQLKADKKFETSQRNKELDSLVRVVVTDSYPNQKHEGDDSQRVEFIGYGNDFSGHRTDKLIFGKPWHLHKGAYENLKRVMHTPKSVNKKTSKMVLGVQVPRYNIELLPHMTIIEIEELKKIQSLRRAAGN